MWFRTGIADSRQGARRARPRSQFARLFSPKRTARPAFVQRGIKGHRRLVATASAIADLLPYALDEFMREDATRTSTWH
jgi:hypothetical protein